MRIDVTHWLIMFLVQLEAKRCSFPDLNKSVGWYIRACWPRRGFFSLWRFEVGLFPCCDTNVEAGRVSGVGIFSNNSGFRRFKHNQFGNSIRSCHDIAFPVSSKLNLTYSLVAKDICQIPFLCILIRPSCVHPSPVVRVPWSHPPSKS